MQSTGRRKSAVARVRVRPGSGQITINKAPIGDYLNNEVLVRHATEALRVSNVTEVYDVDATVTGGGISGQAGALRLGIARAVVGLDPDQRSPLKSAGLLSRDAREKERRKYGLKKARKASQFSKR
ncbi:MAG: 30S ribosomal protein S9 [Acidimicrobiia bacterium]